MDTFTKLVAITFGFVVFLALPSVVSAQKRFVDPNATGANDGTSWDDAYGTIEEALDWYAQFGSGTPGVNKLLIAEDTYTPALLPGGGVDQRERAFTIPQDIVDIGIHGGFLGVDGGSGVSEDPDVPDGAFYRTVLSGQAITGSGPCYHVVDLVQTNTTQTVTLDGFMITGGRGNDHLSGGAVANTRGAGMRITSQGTFDIENIVFIDNWAGADNTQTNEGLGGALYIQKPDSTGEVRVDRCTFRQNYAYEGSGIYLEALGGFAVGNCVFFGNGVIYGDEEPGAEAEPESYRGGAIYLGNETVMDASNCLFFGNAAEDAGGGIYWQPWTGASTAAYVHTLRHCTFADNLLGNPSTTTNGAAIHVGPGFTSSSFIQEMNLWNTIMYETLGGNDLTQLAGANTGVRINVRYTNYIAMSPTPSAYNPSFPLTPGIYIANTYSANPMFAASGSGNYRLNTVSSTLIDVGTGAEVGLDIVDINENQNFGDALPYDLDGSSSIRVQNGIPDLGAYEN